MIQFVLPDPAPLYCYGAANGHNIVVGRLMKDAWF